MFLTRQACEQFALFGLVLNSDLAEARKLPEMPINLNYFITVT